MFNLIRRINQGLRSRILIFRAWRWYSIWAIWEQQSCTQKSGCRLRIISSYIINLYTFFFWRLTWTHGLVVKLSRSESGGSGSIPTGCWNLLQPTTILRGTEPISALTRALFYIAVLSIILISWSSSMMIWRWPGFNSEGEHLTTTWSTWSQGPGLVHKCWPCAWAWLRRL